MSIEQNTELYVPFGCISVGDVLIDVEGYFVRHNDSIVRLEPRSWDVLLYLVHNPGRLVSKQELVDEVWRGAIVSDAAVSQAVLRVRSALGDSSKNPRYVETVPRKGYRLIASVFADDAVPSAELPADESDTALLAEPSDLLIGRISERAALHSLWRRVQEGEPQVVFVDGEAGIGKSEMLRVFLQEVRGTEGDNGRLDSMFSVRTFCAENIGPREAYLPIYELLSRLDVSTEPDVIALAVKTAPTWFGPTPASVSRADSVGALSANAMAREAGTLLSGISKVKPCLIIVEDAQWSDGASLDVLQHVANHLASGDRVMLVISFRSGIGEAGNAIVGMRDKLSGLDLCSNIPLQPLTEDESRLLVSRQVGFDSADVQQLARLVWHWTAGNPFYATSLVEYLVENGYVRNLHQSAEFGFDPIPLPSSLVEAIGLKCNTLPVQQQSVLSAASVIGMRATVAELSGLNEFHHCERSLLDVLEELVAENVLYWSSSAGEKDELRFAHGLYRQVVYNRIRETERRQIHIKIGQYIESTGELRSEQIASLGHHYAEGGVAGKAIPYLKVAAKSMRLRGAESQAALYLCKILEMIPHLSSSCLRDEQEISARVQLLGTSLQVNRNLDTAREVARILELVNRAPENARTFGEISNVFRSLFMGARLDLARPLSTVLHNLAKHSGVPEQVMTSEYAQGCIEHIRGNIRQSRWHLGRAEKNWRELPDTARGKKAMGFRLMGVLAWTHLFENHIDAAVDLIDEVCLLQDVIDPGARATVLNARASMHMLLGNEEAINRDLMVLQELGAELEQVGIERDTEYLQFWLSMSRGESPPEDHVLKAMWAKYISAPQMSRLPVNALALFQGLIFGGRVEYALSILDEAIEDHDRTGFHRDLPELLRLKVCAWLIELRNFRSTDTVPTNSMPVMDHRFVLHEGRPLSADDLLINITTTLSRARSVARSQGNRFWLKRIEATEFDVMRLQELPQTAV